MSIASWTSPAASALTFPISWVISSVTSSLCSASSCANRNSTSPRFGAGTSRQASYAALAAVTDQPLLVELIGRLAGAPVRALATVDDHLDVRVVLVVLDHLVVELVGELPRDHAIDHLIRIVGRAGAGARCVRCSGRRGRARRDAHSSPCRGDPAPRARGRGPRAERVGRAPA